MPASRHPRVRQGPAPTFDTENDCPTTNIRSDTTLLEFPRSNFSANKARSKRSHAYSTRPLSTYSLQYPRRNCSSLRPMTLARKVYFHGWISHQSPATVSRENSNHARCRSSRQQTFLLSISPPPRRPSRRLAIADRVPSPDRPPISHILS